MAPLVLHIRQRERPRVESARYSCSDSASTTRPTIITAKAANASTAEAGVLWMVYSKASVPSATLVIGSTAICVATAGARAPACSDRWLSVMETQPTTTRA